jgi:hypothetical protein
MFKRVLRLSCCLLKSASTAKRAPRDYNLDLKSVSFKELRCRMTIVTLSGASDYCITFQVGNQFLELYQTFLKQIIKIINSDLF